MKVRTLIVDDMPLARERIKRYLKADPNIEIVGEAGDGREALREVARLAPDLIFLDIQMPELDGFAVLEQLDPSRMPAVIFVTAYDQFAIRAFEVHALDYLLKPFSRERLNGAVAHAKEQIGRRAGEGLDQRLRALLEDVRGGPKYIKRLAIKSSGRVIFLVTDEIDWVESAGNYVSITCGREKHLLRERMSQLEARLNPEKFVRIHRSTIVNIDRIKEMHPLFNGDQRIILRDGTELTLSRTYRDRLFSLLDQPS